MSSYLLSTVAAAVIAMSPPASPKAANHLKDEFQSYLLQHAAPGTRLTVLDGWDAHRVAEFTIPDLAFDGINARIKAMEEPLGQFLSWFDTRKGSDDVNLPLLLSRIERIDCGVVLIAGSPVYSDPSNPDHSWYQPDGAHAGYWYPTDGAFFAPRGGSPWHAERARKRLRGARLHWLVTDDTSTRDPAFSEAINRFYGVLSGLEGGSWMGFSDDAKQVMEDLFRTDLAPITFEVGPTAAVFEMRQAKSDVVYNTAATGTGSVSIPLDLQVKPITRVLAVDTTASMRAVYGNVARFIAGLPNGQNTLLVTFSDHDNPGRVVTVFEESEDVSTLARALRAIELFGGTDIPEALGDAMHAVRSEIAARSISEPIDIQVWTDAPPKAAADVPTGIDCVAEIRALIADGHRVTLNQCAPDQDLSWVPEGVTIVSLPAAQR